ncbi:alpha/beta-hydrolase [Sodiomyces alkalinus F11]|uniref:Alpha/beta-hydrolase n=1 Tax=Sodiomyces alkalinus (strain CBS 110278 / VKM F-3762 / F11) TaxID=1314773 RepID=A0A3N2PQF7_SODAK|nr:alpha/beta-hydrolase [Sodiomyces alkalinus F11]ROT36596.1 alpha/beta-hydrolase [Sodiomyces alkalinus F11]
MGPLKLNTVSVSFAVTPTVISTLLSHYLNRKALEQKPTASISYHEGLQLIRSFLQFASYHTVEELQSFTSQWVPHPQWVRVKDVIIPKSQLDEAASLLQAQLGQDGIQKVGGHNWWQWRQSENPLKAEWIEMRSDYLERKGSGQSCRRVMLYVHGGAYYFGSVGEHRYQMQRHARKLRARVLAPEYRLAPQYPFPCGLQDCLAAYLYLLSFQEPNTILLAGDSAGGGMILSIMCTLRDQGIPLPAGAILISPWVDLTHSFPSVAEENDLDYIPASGFHHKPSRAWPPPNEDDMAMIKEQAEKKRAGNEKATKTSILEAKQASPFKMAPATGQMINGAAPPESRDLTEKPPEIPNTSILLSLTIDGKHTVVKDQIQMYTTNELLSHPLVSPVTQPTLGGLPPLLIMVGSGEILRDEQIYLAHKCADPAKYAPPEEKMDNAAKELLRRFRPTNVQLQVWDDLCHVAPTLSFTRPSKYMYRSIAQFGAWALARAQEAAIDILDDDAISVISSSESDSGGDMVQQNVGAVETLQNNSSAAHFQVGMAGDTLPPFKEHMIRQRVTRSGVIYPLPPPSELPACTIDPKEIGVAKEMPVRRWLARKKEWETRYARARARVHRKMIEDMAAGFVRYSDGEDPPPTALAGRRKLDSEENIRKPTKSIGLALWSLWGSKHDEMTVERERRAEQQQTEQIPDFVVVTEEVSSQNATPTPVAGPSSPLSPSTERPQTRSRTRSVVDEHQTWQQNEELDERTPIAGLLAMRKESERKAQEEGGAGKSADFLSPDYVTETGVAGKRPFQDGIALPFSLDKEADSASMVTLDSTGGTSDVRPKSPIQSSSRDAVSTQAIPIAGLLHLQNVRGFPVVLPAQQALGDAVLP